MKYTLDNIELYHLPKEVISEKIWDEKIELPKNVIGIDVENLGFMEFNDTIIGINIDCIFFGITKVAHFKSRKIRHTVAFECKYIIPDDDGNKIIRTDRSDFSTLFYWDSFKEFGKTVKVPIKEFIRYNYNPRIIQNQNTLLEFLNEIKK